MGKIIGVLSLKGGVGKTSSVVSLGFALSEFGKKVLLVDANFSAPNLGTHLNFLNPSVTLHQVLSGEKRIKEAINSHGYFDLILSSVFPKENIDPLKLKFYLSSLKREYDFILIDSSPSLNKETLATIDASDELFVISTPDFSTLSMTLKAIKVAKRRGTPIKGIILNKVYRKKFELSLEDIEKTSEVPVLALLPHDLNVPKSQFYFTSGVKLRPNSELGLEYRKLASCIAGEKFQHPRTIRRFFKILPSKPQINRDIFYTELFGK